MSALRPPVHRIAGVLVGRHRRSLWLALLAVMAVLTLAKMALLIRDVIAFADEKPATAGAAAGRMSEPPWQGPPEPAAGPGDLSSRGVDDGAGPSLPDALAAPPPMSPVAVAAPSDASGATPVPTMARLDPATLTESELEVLEELAHRREALDRRAAELDQRAVVVEIAEGRLEAQLERLRALHDEITAMIGQHDADEEAELDSLVKIYETMKPKAAAEIFDRLELPVLLEVVSRMREASSAEVLARMDPQKAEQVTAALAARTDLLRPPQGG